MRNVYKNVSPRPTDLFCRFCWNDSARLPYAYGSRSLPATTSQLFSQCLSSHILCSCLEIFSTTNDLCNFWRSKFQQVSIYAFCSWDDIFTQNGIAVLPISFASALNPRPRCRRTPLQNGIFTCLEETIL